MLTMNKDELVFVCRSVYLRVACIRDLLHKCVSFLLMFGKVVSKTQKDLVIESLDFGLCLWMIHC